VWKLTADQTWSSATSGNVEIKQGSLDLNGHELTLVCTGGGTFVHKGGNGFAGTGDVVVGDGGVSYCVDETIADIVESSSGFHQGDVLAWDEVLDKLAAGRGGS
jgi:hypothetical protein